MKIENTGVTRSLKLVHEIKKTQNCTTLLNNSIVGNIIFISFKRKIIVASIEEFHLSQVNKVNIIITDQTGIERKLLECRTCLRSVTSLLKMQNLNPIRTNIKEHSTK